jgi:hypothetical protein
MRDSQVPQQVVAAGLHSSRQEQAGHQPAGPTCQAGLLQHSQPLEHVLEADLLTGGRMEEKELRVRWVGSKDGEY